VKKVSVLAALLLTVCLVQYAPAQTNGDSLKVARSAVQAERLELIAANLNLSESESAIFWPLYREYRTALDQANDKRVDLLVRYFASHETLTDEEAISLLNEHLAWKKEVLTIHTSYAKKMNKVLPGKVVARFFQIENKMDTIVEYEMASDIPLVK
jgi:hypothetical protein